MWRIIAARPTHGAGQIRWISEVQTERLRHEIEFSRANGQQRMTREQIRSLVRQLGDIVLVLRNADARDKAEIYAQLGLTLTYQHNEPRVVVEARPDEACTKQRVRGGT